jgi:hypothetical protein
MPDYSLRVLFCLDVILRGGCYCAQAWIRFEPCSHSRCEALLPSTIMQARGPHELHQQGVQVMLKQICVELEVRDLHEFIASAL